MKEPSLSITTKANYVQVALATPLRHCFDYLAILSDTQNGYILQPGIRVQVPFGKQIRIGIIVSMTTTTSVPIQHLKPILKIIDQEPLFSTTLQKLLLWASNYYQCPLGLVFDVALTTPLRKGKDLHSIHENIATSIQETTYINNNTHKITSALIDDNAPINTTLENTNVATIVGDSLQPSLFSELPLSLNISQQTALHAIQSSLGIFQPFLLDGVTGSGKTEVYLQAITYVLQQNKQTLILIPEINLTPQTLAQFKKRFNVPVAVFHSQISHKERTETWYKAKIGIAQIIIGTRSAAFLPLKNPGLFILDEEHDLSFKQQDSLRYSARDLLIKRAQLENCPIVLGSATPALESLWNARQNRYIHLQLPERAGCATPPKIEILDIRHKQLKHGLSLQLLEQIDYHLKNNGQVLLFLNRRGYAPVLMCNVCNFIHGCKSCDAKMILHFYPTPRLICHHCQTINQLPNICPSCKAQNLLPVGLGTEKLEHILQNQFPTANIVRVDRDVMRKKQAMQNIVEQILTGKANILIGTQMLAKGHHFPKLSLVAIIDIDSALYSSDFRAIERMGQLITQVAGRAGRAELPGHVILQTQHPEHPCLTILLNQGYHALCEVLLEERKTSMLPPFSYQVLFKAASKYPSHALNFLSWIKAQNSMHVNKIVKILGPIPSPIEKKADYFRAQLLLQANKRQYLQQACEIIINKIYKYHNLNKIRWSVDVDPLDF